MRIATRFSAPARLAVLSGLSGLLLTGCGYEGASSLPLPGAIGGEDTYTVTVVLPDATNLVAKETCRANDTVVGSVESVRLTEDLQAEVVCRIKNSITLPGNTVATLKQTSLLGERFVALGPPPGQEPVGDLGRNVTLAAGSTRTDPDVEMVFGALSQVLNGGSLGSLETITRELSTALSGADLGGTLDQVGSVVARFNDRRTEITAALTSLDRLAVRLAEQRNVLGDALDSIPGGLAVLERNREKLVRTLTKVSDLSEVAVPLIRSTRENAVADLEHLAPVLAQLAKAGDELALTLSRVVTFPFPSNALSSIRGDFAGFYGTIELDIDQLNRLLGGSGIPPALAPGTVTGSGTGKPLPPLPGLSALEPVTGSVSDLLTTLLGGGS